MKTKQCLVIVMTLLCLCVKAQNLRVTGVVRDKSDVIIGASVMVKNSTVGTVTDMDGRYSVEVSVSAILSCRPFFILIFLPYIKMNHYGFSRKSIWKNLETFP